MNKPILLTSGILAALALPAGADTVLTNFDGAGFFDTDSLDWAPGNALAVDAVPLTAGETFTTYLQAELTEIANSGGGTKNIPIGASGPYEVTFVIELDESVGAATDFDGDGIPDSVLFNHLGGTVKLFWDDFSGGSINADGFGGNAGTGYDDGTLILQADVVPTLIGANFNLTNGSANNTITDLDGFGANNLPGVASVTGVGSASVEGAVTFVDENFITGLGQNSIIEFFINATLENPFNSVNPELLVGGSAPNYGANNINGIYGGTGIESFQFEQDGNSSFATVSAPGALALLGAGLGLLGFFRRRLG